MLIFPGSKNTCATEDWLPEMQYRIQRQTRRGLGTAYAANLLIGCNGGQGSRIDSRRTMKWLGAAYAEARFFVGNGEQQVCDPKNSDLTSIADSNVGFGKCVKPLGAFETVVTAMERNLIDSASE